jgi:xanthine permease
MNNNNKNNTALIKLGILGLQHVLAMYAGAVIIPLIVGQAIGLSQIQITYLVSADLLSCGIATLIQSYGIRNYAGIKLPVIMGCTFTAVAPMIAIGTHFGMAALFGTVIISGLVVLFAAPLFEKILHLFPTVVAGTVIIIIGLTLIPVAMNNIGGGTGAADFGAAKHLELAAFVIILILLINKYAKGFVRDIAILIGLLIGTLIAYFYGLVDLTTVAKSSWFNVVRPCYFGFPKFSLTGSLSMTLVALITIIESTGVFYALGKICNKSLTEKDIVKGLKAEGLSAIISGIFNSFPHTTFSQNVGLVILTKTFSRYVTISAGILLLCLGLLPKFAALATIIPSSVLGGAMLIMFGIVIASGIKILSAVDLHDLNNLIIIACSLGIGLGITVCPNIFVAAPQFVKILFSNGIVSGGLAAIILNVFLNGIDKNSHEV